MQRREFLKQAGLATAASGISLGADGNTVAVVVEPNDYVANRPPVKWAVSELQGALRERNVQARVIGRLAEAAPADRCVLIANQGGAAESVRLSVNTMGGRSVVQC